MSIRLRPDPMTTALRALLGLACLLLAGNLSPACALEIREVRWGFAGGVTRAAFNLCSVRVANPSEQAYDGVLSLQQADNLGGTSGVRWVAPCYVAPLTERWVQFYPYVRLGGERWLLSWIQGTSRATRMLDKPRLLGQQRVLLVQTDPLIAVAARLPAFPADLFPPLLTATDSLAAVALDAAPRWEASRRDAFLGWLRRGGTVFLLPDADDRMPRFDGPLAVLNGPLPRWSVGGGQVIKLPVTRRELSEQWLAANGHPLPPPPQLGEVGPDEPVDALVPALRRMTRPEHNWTLIWWLAFFYLLLIGPVNYLVGRRHGRYLKGLALFLGAVAGFCLLFHTIGRRGYGEESAVHAIGVARALGDGRYDLTQWGNCFVTSGGRYTVEHTGEQRLYEAAKGGGLASSGKLGKLGVQIPLFASRGYEARLLTTGPRAPIQVARWQGKRLLRELRLRVGDDFPAKTHGIFAVRGDMVYGLQRTGNELRLNATRRAVQGLLTQDALSQLSGRWWMDESNARKTFELAVDVLIVRQLGLWRWLGDETGYNPPGASEDRRELPPRPADRVDLFVHADAPAADLPAGKSFAQRVGRVLYHHVLRLEGK